MAYNASIGMVALATASGTYESINMDWIQADSVDITPHQRTDLDSYVNGNGVLKRTVLLHYRTKISLTTTILTASQLTSLRGIITRALNYGIVSERKVHVKYFDPEANGYTTGTFYIPDITYNFKTVLDGVLYYQPIQLTLIEY